MIKGGKRGRRATGRWNREAIRQCDGNTEDAEVWRGRVLLFRSLGAPTDVRASASYTHIHVDTPLYAGRASHPQGVSCLNVPDLVKDAVNHK